MWFTLARVTRLIMISFWTLFFLGAVGNYLATLAHDPAKGFSKTWTESTLGSLLSGSYGLFLILLLVALLILTIIVYFITERLKQSSAEQAPSISPNQVTTIRQRDTLNTGTIQQGSHNFASPSSNFGSGSYVHASVIEHLTIAPPTTPQPLAPFASKEEVLAHYLYCLVGDHKGLNPRGIHQSQLLISVNVPLDDIFIHLKANADTPVYDIAELEDFLHDPSLSEEQREDLRLKTHIRWESQKGLDRLLALKQRQNVSLEEVLQAQNKRRQASVLLGAPGSGKSTALRWLTLHMSQALLPPNDPDYHALAQELLPLQLPILLRIADYARRLETDKLSIQQLPFERFLQEHLTSVYSEQTARVLHEEILQGRCLLLFDGLDEVANNHVRRTIITSIQRFLRDHLFLAQQNDAATYNRCIITSRIVGYEKGDFTETNYSHYTLLELEEKQVADFLTAWCPAVERFQAKALYKTGVLSAQQEQQVQQLGRDQKERLLRALQQNPRTKRLAANPLMLTILALVQRSNRQLPQRRIELYDIVTRTFLDTWNKESGRMFFTGDDVSLAERLLCELANRLHSSDPLLSRAEVEEIMRKIIAEKQERDPAKISEQEITSFLDTIRSSSGLFVESGLNLFSFMHRTFQEYYVARFLLNKPQEEFKAFIVEHYHQALWREPFLLALAAKSSEVRRGRNEASNVLTAIVDTPDPYDAILQRNLLFAATCIVDCGVLSIKREVQAQIANSLFDLYDDIYGQGRYQPLRKEIEEVALAWLQMQELSSPQQSFRVPLLAAWHAALCNIEALPERQEGAVFLLASIAPDLATCPAAVLLALLPPLIMLASVQDMCYPPEEIRMQLVETRALPATFNTEEYALLALRLLDSNGPAGWLHAQWVKWDSAQPELLELLTKHALELNELLTPAALPSHRDDPNWNIQKEIGSQWQHLAQKHPHALQAQLLNASSAARFPHAYLFKRLLEQEHTTSSTSWRTLWDTMLVSEMAQQRSATYQICLDLRLLLSKKDQQRQTIIAQELTEAVRQGDKIQPILALTNVYILDLRNDRNLRYILDLRNLRYILDHRYLLDDRYLEGIKNLINRRYILDTIELRSIKRIRDTGDLMDIKYIIAIRYNSGVEYIIDLKIIISVLCKSLEEGITQFPSASLLLLYIMLDFSKESSASMQHVVNRCLQTFMQHSTPLTTEHLLVISNVQRLIEPPIMSPVVPISTVPDMQAERLSTLRRECQLTEEQVDEILAASIDTRRISEEKQQELQKRISVYCSFVQDVSWKLFNQTLNFTDDALSLLIERLSDPDVMVCAMVARLLRNAKSLAPETREKVMQKIMIVLADVVATSRSTPYGERIDDILFETLKGLAE